MKVAGTVCPRSQCGAPAKVGLDHTSPDARALDSFLVDVVEQVLTKKAPPPPLEEGDIVRIERQPKNQFAMVEGLVGFIEEMRDGMAQVLTLTTTGKPQGGGTIPLDCLVALKGDPVWEKAKATYDAQIRGLYQPSLVYSRGFKAMLADVGAKHGLTADQVRTIYDEIGAWEQGNNPYMS